MHPSALQSYRTIWQNLQDMRAQLPPFYMDDLRNALVEHELAGLPFGMLVHAYDIHPTPLTADIIQACVPYYHTTPFTERLIRIAEAGLFQSPEPNHYLLTEDANQRVDAVLQSVYTALGQLELLAPADLDWLVAIFQGMLERSFANNYPTPAADMEYKPHRTRAIAPLAQFAATVDVLVNFRCDSHQAAWRDLAISAPAVEVWTIMWREQANSVQSVMDVLAQEFPRGYSLADYQGFVDELVGQGWLVAENDNNYRLTEAGQQQRDAIEDKTNVLFFAPWEDLTTTDLERLNILSQELIAQLEVVRAENLSG